MWLRKTSVKASLGDSECIWLFITDFGCPTSKSKQKRSTEGEGVWVYLIFNIVVVVFFRSDYNFFLLSIDRGKTIISVLRFPQFERNLICASEKCLNSL